MPDVVGPGTEDLTEDGARPADRLRAATLQHAGHFDGGGPVAGRSTARAVLTCRLGLGVEVQRLRLVDQHEAHTEVVAVKLVDPVDQRDLLRQHVLGAEEVGVGGVVDQSQPVRPQLHVARRRINFNVSLAEEVALQPSRHLRLDERRLPGQVLGPRHGVHRGATPFVRRRHHPVPRAANGRVHPQRRHIDDDPPRGVVNGDARISA